MGNEDVDAFTEVIKEIDLEARKEAIAILEERFERRLIEEVGKLRVGLSSEIEKNRSKIENIRTEVAVSRADTIKSMFIFWIGQIGVLSGIIFAMLKLFSR